MYKYMTIPQLEAELKTVKRHIEQLRSLKGRRANNCRRMRTLEANQLEIWNALLQKQLQGWVG